jgi:hypothetical protein
MKTLVAVIALGLLAGSANAQASLGPQVSLGLWLNFDQTQSNTLDLQIPPVLGGGVRSTRLVGGAHTIVSFDLFSLISPQGLSVNVVIDEIRIAGESFDIFPGTPSGTLCVTGDPAGAGSGVLLLPLLAPPSVIADFHTQTFLTGPLEPFLPDGIRLAAHIEDQLQVDLLSLFRSNFQGGPAVVRTSATGTVPADVVFFGGAPFALNVTLFNSFTPPADPLLTECDAFLGAR